MAENFRIKSISSEGRIGKVNLEIEGKEFSWEWELGSGKCLVIISVPTLDEWSNIFSDARLNRGRFLSKFAKKIIKLECKKCSFKISNNEIVFFEHA